MGVDDRHSGISNNWFIVINLVVEIAYGIENARTLTQYIRHWLTMLIFYWGTIITIISDWKK